MRLLWKSCCSILFVLGVCFPLRGQATRIMESNRDLGRVDCIIWDSVLYPREELDSELLRVEYASLELDLAFAEGRSEGHWVLQVGGHCSRFVTFARFKGDSLFADNQSREVRINLLTRKVRAITLQEAYYVDRSSRKLCFTGRLVGDDYLYEEELPSIPWIIRDSVKTICGCPCRQAEGDFRGRRYTVFFAEDIPVSYGPWKLQGLPGLILEAYDSEGRIRFVAESIRPSEEIIWRAKYPYIHITRKEYEQMVRQMQEQYIVFAHSHISRTDIIRVGLDDAPQPKGRAIAPLELEE